MDNVFFRANIYTQGRTQHSENKKKDMFKKKLGIEIEFTGIIRNKVSKLVAEYLGGTVSDARDYYNTKLVTAQDGRK